MRKVYNALVGNTSSQLISTEKLECIASNCEDKLEIHK